MANDRLEKCSRSIASELSRLQFHKLDPEWVTEVIDSDFLECPDLPVAFEELLDECNVNVRFSHIQNSLLSWLQHYRQYEGEDASVSQARQSVGTSQMSVDGGTPSTSTNRGAQFWGFLLNEQKLNLKSLQALLGFAIDRGCGLTCSTQERQLCFSAAKLYLTTICIPGSMAFGVFHQMLYMKALQLIQLYMQVMKYHKSTTPSSQGSKKKKKAAAPLEPEDDVEEEEDSPIDMDTIKFVENNMSSYLETVSLVAQHLSFKRYPSVLKETIECMLPIISLNRGKVCMEALGIVQQFCDPLHGDAVQTVHYVFTHILPYLSLDPSEKDLNNKDVVALKDISFDLVRSFIDKFGETIYSLVKGLIQHVCIDVVDRAEYRQRTAQTALDLLELVPLDHQKDITQWFLLLAHAEQAFLRLFCMELFALLLQHDRVDALVLTVIFNQCSDASATVRAKALALLGDCIESRNESMVELFNFIFGNRQQMEQEENHVRGEAQDQEEVDLLELLQAEEPIVVSPALLPSAAALLDLLKDRAVDEKVYVRKNALQLLLDIARRHGRYLNQELLKLFGNSCRDIALLIRRHMTQMLTELVLDHPENQAVLLTWARSVLPLVLDGETRVQEKALECTDQLILQSLVGNDSQLGWSLLDIITQQGLGSYLSKAVELWARQQQLKPNLLRTLHDNARIRSQSALTFIAIIVRHIPIGNNIKDFALDYLQEHIGTNDSASVYCIQQIYKIIGYSLPSMTKDQLKIIKNTSIRYIASFHLATDLIPAACDTVVFCIQQQGENEEAARKEASDWAKEILTTSGEYLNVRCRKQEGMTPDEEDQIARRIVTLGCVALHCPKEINKRHFLILQHAAFQSESGVDAPIPSSQALSQPTRKLPASLQAAAVISLGKLSIQHEEMAKQLIPGLGRLLETTPHEAIRNNIVCILCDWVVRYSTAIDPVMSQVTACLRDPSPAVKKQTLVLLIHLLQEDYLKIRGTFFFRILQLACDDDEALRELALFYVTQRLLHRQPTIIQQHFIECVFHYNDYKGHPTYNKFALTDRERQLFSIAGPNQAPRRFQIYRFMLQNLDDEARFQLTFRLSRDVLLGVVEDVMSLKNASTEAVLKDALAVLASDDIKLASLTAQTDDDPAEKEDLAHAIVQQTKKAIIAQVVKRNVIENIVPIVVSLKRKLALLKSPLMGKLMHFLRKLMKDYKNEIEEILAEDRQLMAEIDFDLKRFEQQEKLEANRQSVAPRNNQSTAPPPELARQENSPNRKSRGSGGPAVENERPNQQPVDDPPVLENMEVDDELPEPDANRSTDGDRRDSIDTQPPQVVTNANVVTAAEISPTTLERAEPARGARATPSKKLPKPLEDVVEPPPSPGSPADEEARIPKDRLPPKNPVARRLLKTRFVSTPKRDAPVDEVSFKLPAEVDLSAIRYDEDADSKGGNKRHSKRKRL